MVTLLKDWSLSPTNERLVVRLAVTEAESWLLADREGFAKTFRIPINKIPHRPDEEHDPKRLILTLAKKSKLRRIRDKVVSEHDRDKPGTGYNLHLENFARTHWDAQRAAHLSPSLAKALKRLEILGAAPTR